MEEKIYSSEIKIKTNNEEFRTKFFPNLDTIIYKNVDYRQLVKDAIQKIVEAYETQNIILFDSYVSSNFLGNKNFLIEGVRNDFNFFYNIKLDIFVERVEKNADKYVIISIKWNKTQMVYKTGLQQRTSGKTTMIFEFDNGILKLKNLKGNLIFATLSPEIAQTSGLSQTVVEKIHIANEKQNPVQPGSRETNESGGVKDDNYTANDNVKDGNDSTNNDPGETGKTEILLSVKNGSVTSTPPPPPSNVHSYDFLSGEELTKDNGDFNFLLSMGTPIFESVSPSGIQKLSGINFDNLTTAPESGYLSSVPVSVGDIIVFKTKEEYYGKAEIISITITPYVNDNITFKYALQSNGTTNLKTK